jgi:hypothetical protein
MRESEIEQWVLHELELAREVTTKEICALCTDGIATLNGTVNNHQEKRAAQKACERAVGVRGVINHINVCESTNRPITQPSPLAIAAISRASARQEPIFSTSVQI